MCDAGHSAVFECVLAVGWWWNVFCYSDKDGCSEFIQPKTDFTQNCLCVCLSSSLQANICKWVLENMWAAVGERKCVCVCERDRETQRESVCVCEREMERDTEREKMCVRERMCGVWEGERESVCVFCLCVFCLCVLCVCGLCVCLFVSVFVCVCVCVVFVCVCECVCVCFVCLFVVCVCVFLHLCYQWFLTHFSVGMVGIDSCLFVNLVNYESCCTWGSF